MDQPDTVSLSRPAVISLTSQNAAQASASASRARGGGTMSGTSAKRTMNFTEAVSIATSSLWAHKLRSALTLLGVVIGVAAVIAVVSLINGANQYVATRVFRLGADVFGLSKQPSIITNVDDWLEFQKRKRVDIEDYDAVKELCKSCKGIGASLGGRVEVRSGVNSLKDTNLRAWTPEMAELYDVDLIEGRHITDADLKSAWPSCVVGTDIVDIVVGGGRIAGGAQCGIIFRDVSGIEGGATGSGGGAALGVVLVFLSRELWDFEKCRRLQIR
jgi:hypothetical protein